MNDSSSIFLYGAGGHAKVIIDILASNGILVQGIYDDNPQLTEICTIPITHNKSYKFPIIISIGNNNIRKKIVKNLQSAEYIKAIDSRAIISKQVKISEGTVVMQGAIIQSCSIVGKHVIINTGAKIDHDCTIEDFVHIAPGSTLCGNVSIGEGSFIGAGSTIIPGVKVGKWSIVGAGSTVIRDIPDNVVAVGSPCRIIKTII